MEKKTAPTATTEPEDSLQEVSVQIDDAALSDNEDDKSQDSKSDNSDDSDVESKEQKAEQTQKATKVTVVASSANTPKRPKNAAAGGALRRRRRRRSAGANELDDAEIDRRARGPKPPLPANGDFLFYILLMVQLFNLGFLWWGWRASESNSSFVILLTVNGMALVAEFFYFREVIHEQAKEFYNLWWSKTEPVKRKMKGVIELTCQDSKQLVVLFMVGFLQCATAVCAFPAVVLRGEWWGFVERLPIDIKMLFIFLVITTIVALMVCGYITYITHSSMIYACTIIENNDYAILDDEDLNNAYEQDDDLPVAAAVAPTVSTRRGRLIGV